MCFVCRAGHLELIARFVPSILLLILVLAEVAGYLEEPRGLFANLEPSLVANSLREEEGWSRAYSDLEET